MSNKIYITGLGIISAIGNNVTESLDALNNKRTGVHKLRHLRTRHQDSVPVGEIDLSDAQLIELCGLPADLKTTRTALLGLIAAKEAVTQANLSPQDGLRTGVISATSVGGMGITENLWLDYLNPEKTGDRLKYIETNEC